MMKINRPCFLPPRALVGLARIDRKASESPKLVLNKIGPRLSLILEDARLGPRGLKPVLVHSVHGAKITEVPVERGMVVKRLLCDGRHHDVATVARVAGNGERPGLGRTRRQTNGKDEGEDKGTHLSQCISGASGAKSESVSRE